MMNEKIYKYGPEYFEFSALEDEEIPNSVPDEVIQPVGEVSPERKREILESLRVVPYLGSKLLEGAWRLVELSRNYEGRFREGMDITVSCRAISSGAITLACAAFEAYLNEEIYNASSWANELGFTGKSRLLDLSTKLSPRDRLDALAATYDFPIDWGTEPYQSLDLVFSIRKHLLHHEIQLYPAIEGHWPAKKLTDIKKRINSPYSDDLILDWHKHILTPAGAEWVVTVICDVLARIETLWMERRDSVENHDLTSKSAIGQDENKNDV
jgi:hypothetical protein